MGRLLLYGCSQALALGAVRAWRVGAARCGREGHSGSRSDVGAGKCGRSHAAATPARRSAATANWLKLRAFGLTQYDAVLLVDSNAYIGGDISPLFNLPTDFAAGWDQVRCGGWGLARVAAQAVSMCAACVL